MAMNMGKKASNLTEKTQRSQRPKNEPHPTFFKTQTQIEREKELAQMRVDLSGTTFKLISQLEAAIKALEDKIIVKVKSKKEKKEKIQEAIEQIHTANSKISNLNSTLGLKNEELQKTEESIKTIEKEIEILRAKKSKFKQLTTTIEIVQQDLFNAIECNNMAKVEQASQAGALINGVNARGLTPLHYAASRGKVEIIKLLLSKNPHIDVQDKKGRTALHYAACENLEAVQLLLQAGANPLIKDNDGLTASDITMEDDIENLIKESQTKFKTTLETKPVETPASLLSTKVSTNSRFGQGAHTNFNILSSSAVQQNNESRYTKRPQPALPIVPGQQVHANTSATELPIKLQSQPRANKNQEVNTIAQQGIFAHIKPISQQSQLLQELQSKIKTREPLKNQIIGNNSGMSFQK